MDIPQICSGTYTYNNAQQVCADPTSSAYQAAHPVVTVAIPPTVNSLQGSGTIPQLSAAAGVYGTGVVSYTAGMNYNNKGTNAQGQILLVVEQPGDGTYYIKSNSISSVAFSNPVNGVNKDVTVYTKASIYKVANGVTTSIDGNVTLRMDAHDGGTNGDTLGFTVLSGKDGSLYYSSNWIYDTSIQGYRTVQQSIASPAFITIN